MSSGAPLPEPEDAADHPVQQRALEIFRSGARAGSAWISMAIVVAFFALSYRESTGLSLGSLALAGGAVLFRDLGRWVGARVLGYPDAELLLFPFFRKALPAEGDRTEQWRRGVVILLGPLPGLVIAFALAVAVTFAEAPGLRHAVFVVTVVNAAMLAPLSTFDGGRILDLVVFSRSRWLELVFSLLTVAALALAAWQWSSIVYGILALFGLVASRTRFRVTGAVAAVRARFPSLPVKPVKVPDAAGSALFHAADALVTGATRAMMHKGDVRAAPVYAGLMQQIHDGAVQKPPSAVSSFLLLLAYVGGVGLAASTLVLTFVASGGKAP
jgi:hypothetical protein